MTTHTRSCRFLWLVIASLLVLATFANVPTAQATAEAQRPNVVLIMTDNHGAWTLGCYGNPDIRTPHIDRLAAEGVRFTHAFASNPVCSPTRATCLTGLMPSQHGVHCFLFGGRLQIGPDARCTLDRLRSLPEVLRDTGYACGLVGKWHLGDNLHPQEGLDDYWITMPHGGTSTFYNAPIIEGGKVRNEPTYLTDFWTEHAVRFIQQKSEADQPFFLFLAYNGPYALGRLLLQNGQNRHAAYYADKPLASFPREAIHPWQYNNRDYQNNPVSIRRVATEVSGVDDGVGRVMATLKECGVDENTVVILLADQGWVGGHGGFFGMGDHTRPLTARDGMMQIPMIWRHPGKIAAGQTSDRLVANYDLMPTLLTHLGIGDKMPNQPKSPGVEFTAEFTAKFASDRSPANPPASRPHDAVFYEFENLRCIRTRHWKYVHRHPNGPHELYDLREDADEFENLAHQEAFAATRDRLKQQLDAFFAEHAEPEFDLWQGGGSQTRIFVGIDEELAQQPAAEPPPLSDGFSVPEITVPDGFTVELAAGPPLVTHPTLACFDDRGRLFVCNNAGVNLSAAELEEQLPNSIRMLEDRDGDGRFDRSTVFADKMTYPMGGAWHDGALYVASPPYIWRLADTDDDGVADQRQAIVKKFGYTGNAASIHGCFFGPDGRLYWCDGYHGHEFRDATGNVTSQREGSYLFSCLPDGSDVRIHCGGGMDNPVEVDFTKEGDMLGTVNILYSRPRVDCMVHWLYGGVYPHRERVLGETKITGDLLGPMHRFGHVAVSGTTRYRSGVIDHRWTDDFFVTHFNSGKVVRLNVQAEGSTYRATQREFLSCASRDFHPTDVLEDADGSLLVIDTGGWFYRGCPTSQLSKPDVLGAIYRVRRRGMTTQVDPWGGRIAWEDLTAAQLASKLNDTRFKVRERAIAECARRGDAMLPTLQSVVQRRDLRDRRNAVWALTRIRGRRDSSTARAAIRTALSDRDASVRQAACHSLATYPDPAAMAALLGRLKDEVPAVRRQAATAIGRLGDPQAVAHLLENLAATADRAEEHAIIYALIEINNAPATAAGLAAARLASDNDNVRRGALIALDQMDAGRLSPDQVGRLLQSDNPLLRQTALQVFQRRRNQAEWAAVAGETVAARLAVEKLPQGHEAIIRGLVTTFAAQPRVQDAVTRALNSQGEVRQIVLQALATGSNLPMHDEWSAPLETLLQSRDTQQVHSAIVAIAAINTDRFQPALQQLAGNENVPVLTRIAALEAVAGRGRMNDAAFEMLIELLDRKAAPQQAARAAQLLGAAPLTRPQLVKLAERLPAAGPLELRDLIRPFQRDASDEAATAFLDAMEQATALTSIATHEFSDIIKRYPASLRPRGNALLDQIRHAHQQRLARLDDLLALLDQGDPQRGRDVFFAEKSKCSACHRIQSQGGRIGPDLSTIGRNRSPQDLLESIVFPSASFVRDYEPKSVITIDGRVYSGLIARETGDTLFLQQQAGEPVRIPVDQIEEIAASTVSIMPSGLDKALTENELADVIAYLMTLK